MRLEVESLLAAHEEPNSLIDKPIHQLAADLLAEDATPALEGRVIGPYEVKRELGRGGMGEVYLARDMRLGRPVALKLLSAPLIRDIERVRRFEQEARAVSALNHPNIVTIFEITEHDGLRFIATEYIEGETLRERIAKRELTLTEALDIVIQVCGALSAAHETGIIHRDIKPENIMLRRDGYVKVLDFGLAKLAEETAARREWAEGEASARALVSTTPGLIMGTPAYMSPEQARGLKTDARSDIWSLGVVLYEMVTRRLPFEGPTTADILATLLHHEPSPLTRYNEGVPAELEPIAAKALTKEREERYQTAKEFGLNLKRLRQRLGTGVEFEPFIAPEGKAQRAAANATTGEGPLATSETGQAAQTAEAGGVPTTSSAKYITSEIKRLKRGAILALAMLLAVGVVIAHIAYSRYAAESSKASIDQTADIDSIAVLPFANTAGNLEAEYLSDGISESLINSLSRLGGVKVIARSSSFKYKGKEVDPQEVARALGVEAILTGRIVQRGDRLSISAEMVDARDGTQVWGEQYNRPAEDLLQVEAEISREIAERLRLRLTASERQQLAKRETTNPQAYELVLKGRLYHMQGGAENRRKAIEYFQQAVSIDPAYALAYAELSEGYRLLNINRSFDPQELMTKAEAAARTALELDESLPEAHFARANLNRHAWQWQQAEREYRRTIELNPNLAVARHGYAHYLSVMKRHDEAIAESRRARELDPLSLTINGSAGYTLFLARRYDEAIEALQKTLELDQSFPTARFILAATYAARKMYREAIAAYAEVIRSGGDNSGAQIYLGVAYAQAGERNQAKAILKRLQTREGYVSQGELAALYGSLGEPPSTAA